MQRLLLVLAACTLAACSRNGDDPGMCQSGQATFGNGKVLLSERPEFVSSILSAGSVFTVVLKNKCENPGELAKLISREENLSGKRGQHSYEFRLTEAMTSETLEEMAETDDCVVGVAKTSVATISALPSDPMVGSQDHFGNLRASSAYPIFYSSKYGTRPVTTIAIIDTGVDVKHADLKANLWVNIDEIPANGKDDDRNGYVDDVNGYNMASKHANPSPEGEWRGNFHGTHVAGLAAARAGNKTGVSGVMGSGSRIMALNVFGAAAGAYSYNTENAIRYAADNGADIINLSIGGTTASASYQAALQYAVSKGVTVLAAAGNETRELGPDYFITPASYGSGIPGMMTIGSVDAQDTKLSYFSNFSAKYVELAAPGAEDSDNFVGLLSTLPDNQYGRLQGTSMATPVATGAAGLAIQLLRALGYAPTPSRIEEALTSSARTSVDLTSKINGGRVLDLKNLADFIVKKYPKRAAPEPGTFNKLAMNGGVPLPCY